MCTRSYGHRCSALLKSTPTQERGLKLRVYFNSLRLQLVAREPLKRALAHPDLRHPFLSRNHSFRFMDSAPVHVSVGKAGEEDQRHAALWLDAHAEPVEVRSAWKERRGMVCVSEGISKKSMWHTAL